MSGKPKLGLDCDGVIADFTGYCLPVINERLGTAYTEDDWTHWATAEWCPAADHIVYGLAQAADYYRDATPYPGAAEAAIRLGRFFDLHVVTSLPERHLELRRAWLHRLGIIPAAVHACRSGDKPTLARELGLSAFVEDNALTAVEIGRAGVPSYLVDRPWNRGEHPLVARVGSLAELADRVVLFGQLMDAVERAGAVGVRLG